MSGALDWTLQKALQQRRELAICSQPSRSCGYSMFAKAGRTTGPVTFLSSVRLARRLLARVIGTTAAKIRALWCRTNIARTGPKLVIMGGHPRATDKECKEISH